MARRTQQRRGIVLLLILSLLVLFLLMGVTFLIVSGQYVKGARAHAKHEQKGDPPRNLSDQVIYQVIRGSHDSYSPLAPHSLLEDMYGGDSVLGQVQSATEQMNGQFIHVQFALDPTSPPFNPIPGAYNGRVLSMLTYNSTAPPNQKPTGAISTRVIDSRPNELIIEAFESDPPITGAAVANVLVSGQFVINGQAFNGSGAGYNLSTSNVDAIVPAGGSLSGYLAALLPNYSSYAQRYNINPHLGGADESYDTFDYQNMYLAMVPANANSSSDIIPSYHRPALINYWMNHPSGAWSNPEFQRAVVMRPLPADHPNFPQLSNLLTGPWDVDNDRDGIRDSIWLHVGLPIETSKDGRRVQPMAAILIKDMDGRLNLNGHSSLAHTDPSQFQPVPGNFAGFPGPSAQTLPRGRGYGPADIYFGHLFGGNTAAEFAAILNGRYGADGGNPPRPGVPNFNDYLGRIKAIGIPSAYNPTPAAATFYASPPDVWGRDAVALDYTGQPFTAYFGAPDPTLDDPYELDLSHMGDHSSSAADAPYTYAEMERLLRWHDLDAATLPDRLVQLAPSTLNGPNNDRNRNLVTVDSRHVPVSNVGIPTEDRDSSYFSSTPNARLAPTVVDLFTSKLLANGVAPANIEFELKKMLPFEVRHGEQFNLNRFLANGRDENNNNAADETAELDANEPTNRIWRGLGLPASFDNAQFNFANNDPLVGHNRYARQIYARHLYCLMMFLIDYDPQNAAGFRIPVTESMNDANKKEITAERIAQWAINAVDFRDPDAICSPFEYDVNPFNGWQDNINGNPATSNDPPDTDLSNDVAGTEGGERRIVWGCEYPDLQLTETWAAHDRRVADTADDDGDGDKRQKNGNSQTMEGDNDLDQIRIPEGSLFLELYCTRNRGTNNPRMPAELYDLSTGALDLARMAPASANGKNYPVWRAAITERPANTARLPRSRMQTNPDSTTIEPYYPPTGPGLGQPPVVNMSRLPASPDPLRIERIVWFAAQDPGNPQTDPEAAITYYNRAAGGAPVQLLPGGYAVVGPRQRTFIGSRKPRDPANYYEASDHVITIGGGVNVTDHDGVSRYPGVGTNIRQPLGIICAAKPPVGWTDKEGNAPNGQLLNNGIGLSVSEPLPQANYYPFAPKFVHNPALGVPDAYDEADPSLRMKQIPDQPFDDYGGRPLNDVNVRQTGTTEDYKAVLLQRLADPTQPFDPILNPYLTVDWSTVDLTVFNGEDQKPSSYPAALNPWDKPTNDPDYDPADTTTMNVKFSTRERGDRPYRRVPALPGSPLPVNPANFDDRLWPSVTTGPLITTPNNAVPDNYFRHNLTHTLGYLNRTMGDPQNTVPAYLGDPARPFPWLTWNNRPFATPLELLLVPACSQARLTHEFNINIGGNPYSPYNGTNVTDARAPFPHLLNFYQSSTNPNEAAHFYRLLDYVNVPSPFVGTEKWYDPTAFAGGGNWGDTFRPPYNRLSRFRDPARVNINTIVDFEVWSGVVSGFPRMNNMAMWNLVQQSRQGYATYPNNNYPTRFAAPFRSAASADLAPDDATLSGRLRQTGVEATLLRTQPGNPAIPLLSLASGNAYENTQRNPYFLYQGVDRLSNLVSTHSNVFAVWITIGYFELEPNPGGVDVAHPDGWRLGRELGSDSGEVTRHRAFYIIDRSIPVAFQPGENHNVDRAIVLRRLIE